MPAQRVVVEGHLQVRDEEPPVGAQRERVDLDQRAVALDESPRQRQDEFHRRLHLLMRQPESCEQVARLERGQPVVRIAVFAENGARLGPSEFLDVHPAARRRDDQRAAAAPVEREAEIEFARQVEVLLDEHLIDRPSARAGLSGDERGAEEFLCGGFGLGPAGDEEHAAGLAASARVDLRLDDGARAAQFVEGRAACSGVAATRPAGTASPRAASSALAWYSWMFIARSFQ